MADSDPSFSNLFKEAKRLQLKHQSQDSIEKLLNQLNLGSTEPTNSYKPGEDNLEDWFLGAPYWLGRS